jgi:hypothetical protein
VLVGNEDAAFQRVGAHYEDHRRESTQR